MQPSPAPAQMHARTCSYPCSYSYSHSTRKVSYRTSTRLPARSSTIRAFTCFVADGLATGVWPHQLSALGSKDSLENHEARHGTRHRTPACLPAWAAACDMIYPLVRYGTSRCAGSAGTVGTVLYRTRRVVAVIDQQGWTTVLFKFVCTTVRFKFVCTTVLLDWVRPLPG